MYAKGRAQLIPLLCFLPGLLLLLVFTVGPSLATVFLSFTDISAILNTPWHFIGLSNYHEFFFTNQRDNLDALERTFIFSFAVTIIQNALALLLALALNRKMFGTTFFRTAIFAPVILGYAIIGIIWTIVLNPVGGPVEQFLHLLGYNSLLLGSYSAAFPIVIGIHIWANVGFSMIIFLAGLQQIPIELQEAAIVDGANPLQRFVNVLFPLLAPAVTVNLLLSVIGSLQQYQIIYVLTQGAFNTSVLGLRIFQTAFGNGVRQGYASALAVIQFFLVLVIALIVQFYLRRREVQL